MLGRQGYTQALSDPCVYFKSSENLFSLLVVVVDDILHVATSRDVIDDFAAAMSQTYAFKNLGEPSLMVGMRITLSPASIRLDQAHYIKQLGESFSQLDAAPVH